MVMVGGIGGKSGGAGGLDPKDLKPGGGSVSTSFHPDI